MILAELRLRDYKQFSGQHVITPESQGITAVIGPNGAGKTTLFEAIEWCLYGPRSITNADVFPRGREGRPEVTVTLEDPVNRQRFVIQRRLKGKTMQAEVWRDGNPEEILATGSAPVRAFVAEQLIGLGHDAFVSTFFTRQKELSFFGSMRPTERRVMVGRLIGVEAVRLAQEQIGQERSQAASRAEGLAAQVEHDLADRDLDAEIATTQTTVDEATALVAQRDAEHAKARQALELANENAERIRLREQQDRALADKLGGLAAAHGRLETELQSVDRELARLAEEKTHRAALEPIAAEQPARLAAVERWAAESHRHERLIELQKQLRNADQDRARAATAAAELVTRSATPLVPEWRWQTDADPAVGIATLLGVATTIDAGRSRAEAQRLQDLLTRSGEVERNQVDLAKYHKRLDQLRAEEHRLLQDGDPALAIARIEKEMGDKRVADAQMRSEEEQARAHASQLTPLLQSLRNRDYGDHCPTCGRDIAPGEAAQVISTLANQVASWLEIATHREIDRNKTRLELEDLTASLKRERQRDTDLKGTRAKLAEGERLTTEKVSTLARLEEEVSDLLAQFGRHTAPTMQDVTGARERADALGAIAEAAQGLAQRQAQLLALAETEQQLRAQITELGQPAYDREQHTAAEVAHNEANRAIATLQQIDRDLARIPAFTEQRARCTAELAGITAEHTAISEERTRLGYQEAEAVKARATVAEAISEERQHKDTLHLAQTALRERRAELKHLTLQKERLQALFERSVALRREADELDRMYREFAAFDQFVASRIAPRLAEQTSELLDIATDGKYNHVEFDENYGIQVFDGPDEKFPLEGYSGGERDVVALCARLALSQVIGSSAAHPPSFLVLDEVFGALDRERRTQLLELLGRISETIDSFQQMFIISHVDDVRASPIFTRVLRIVESEDGSSRIEDATAAGVNGED
jgi:exonuclease SbcC